VIINAISDISNVFPNNLDGTYFFMGGKLKWKNLKIALGVNGILANHSNSFE
jgi:hypothetical protein